MSELHCDKTKWNHVIEWNVCYNTKQMALLVKQSWT